MKIKTKLRLGFGFLFLVVILFGATSLFYINEISLSSKVILKDNYETLRYTRSMRSLLDNNDLPFSSDAISKFKTQLNLETKNITEKGEKEAVNKLKTAFDNLINDAGTINEKQLALKQMKWQLAHIDELNMSAIFKKNEAAGRAIEQATLYIIFAATVCFMILFTFIINFPGFVADPLKRFSAAIKEISKKNYKQHLEFKGTDEFADLANQFNNMVTQLIAWDNSNVAKLLSEKLRIEAIIEQMNDAIIGVNEKNELLFFNDVAGKLLDLEKLTAIGSDVIALTQKNDLLKRILQTNSAERAIKIYSDHKESYFQLEKRKIYVPHQENTEQAIMQTAKSSGEVFILKNVTQYKELDEAKTNFIATVSHELKTPISSIKMSLLLMDDERIGSMNSEQKELIQHIEEDCNRLLKITSELLDLAQVETGNLVLNFSKSEPNKIAAYAIDSMKFQAVQKFVQLELICEDNLPKINVDVEKTAWVLINFLSNALRYSTKHSKIITKVAKVGNNVEFSVRDFGKGIEEKYQNKLFNRYFQIPTDGINKSGSGLGLSISKDFIEAEGGEIWVESDLGEGSKFCFSLPAVY